MATSITSIVVGVAVLLGTLLGLRPRPQTRTESQADRHSVTLFIVCLAIGAVFIVIGVASLV